MKPETILEILIGVLTLNDRGEIEAIYQKPSEMFASATDLFRTHLKGLRAIQGFDYDLINIDYVCFQM